MIRKHACPNGYHYYFVDCMSLLGRSHDSFWDCEVYSPIKGWRRDRNHAIADRLIGFDPFEDPGWKTGNSEIMDEIREISRIDAKHLIRVLRKLKPGKANTDPAWGFEQ